MPERIPTGRKGAALQVIADNPGATVAEVCALLHPRPRFEGPVRGAENYRARMAARAAWAAEVESMRRAVSGDVRRLSSDGWLLPASVARLTPYGRRLHARANQGAQQAVRRALRLAVVSGDAPAESSRWDLDTVGQILAALAFGESGKRATADRLGCDCVGHAFRAAWERGAALGLWWLPQQRLASPQAVAAGLADPWAPVSVPSTLPAVLPALEVA